MCVCVSEREIWGEIWGYIMRLMVCAFVCVLVPHSGTFQSKRRPVSWSRLKKVGTGGAFMYWYSVFSLRQANRQ